MKRWLRRWLGIEDANKAIAAAIKAEVEKAKAEIEKAMEKAHEDLRDTGSREAKYIKAQAEILAEHDASFVDLVVESINRKQLK